MTLLRLLTGYLREHGFFVVGTDDANQALESIEAEPWDLVITDGALKTSCGEDFAADAIERRKEIPVVLITGAARMARDLPLFRGVLHKPFQREDFLRFVGEALDHPATAPAAPAP